MPKAPKAKERFDLSTEFGRYCHDESKDRFEQMQRNIKAIANDACANFVSYRKRDGVKPPLRRHPFQPGRLVTNASPSNAAFPRGYNNCYTFDHLNAAVAILGL